jgi:hypothetical protein
VTAPDPFAALGLPARPGLTDEQVRAAWRHIAAATHPDREDGGDLARYTAAVAAYGQLRTAWGRSEACADLTAPQAYTPPPAPDAAPAPPAARAAAMLRAACLFPARVRHGRPLRLVIRALAASVMCLLALHVAAGTPSAPALVTGIITWFAVTLRADLAPMPGR